jgi:hypothetical protein
VGLERLQATGGSAVPRVIQQLPSYQFFSGVPITLSADVTIGEINRFTLRVRRSNEAGIDGVFTTDPDIVIGETPPADHTITNLGGGRYRITRTITPTETATGISFGVALRIPGGGNVPAGLGAFVSRLQAEIGSQATEYQKTETDIVQKHYWYLFFGGSSDPRTMVTPIITPGTDRAQVFAGVRKLAANATMNVFDMPGGPRLQANRSASVQRPAFFNGTAERRAAIYPNPITQVLQASTNRTGATVQQQINIRVNGVDENLASAGSPVSGDIPAAALEIGGQSTTVNNLNGEIYGLIVRFGPSIKTSQIKQIEIALAEKSDVTVPTISNLQVGSTQLGTYNLALARLYNRQLNSEEIIKNFKAEKARFGL